MPSDRPRSLAGSRLGVAPVAILAIMLSSFVAWRILASAFSSPGGSGSVAALAAGTDGTGRAPSDMPGFPAPDASAVARARAVLQAEPLSAEAYVVLALAAERAGEAERALRLMRIAAGLWPRELTAEAWLLAWSLKRGEFRSAMAHLDVIGRTRPDRLDDLTGALAPLASHPATAGALADALAAEPPWRFVVMSTASRLWTPDALVSLLRQLQDRPPGPTLPELRPVLTRLVALGRVEEAHRAWLRSLPEPRRRDLADLYNGDFRQPVTDMPFDWTVPSVASTAVSFAPEGDPPSVTVAFLGGRVSGRPLVHDLVLAPGAYRLTGRVRADRLQVERGVRWQIACRESPDRPLATSEPVVGTVPWRDVSVAFTIPDAECRSQILGLEVDSRTARDREISGVVSFAALAIARR